MNNAGVFITAPAWEAYNSNYASETTGYLVYSNDQGDNWRRVFGLGNNGGFGHPINSSVFLNDTNGYLASEDGYILKAKLIFPK